MLGRSLNRKGVWAFVGVLNSLFECVVADHAHAAMDAIKRTIEHKHYWQATLRAMTLKRMKPKLAPCWRLLAHSWAATIASTVLALTASKIATSTTPAIPFDEPLCFMKTQDGRVVNLQRLCGPKIAPTKTSPASNRQPAASSPRSTPQAELNSASFPFRALDPSGSHAQGNPDSDDGRY